MGFLSNFSRLSIFVIAVGCVLFSWNPFYILEIIINQNKTSVELMVANSWSKLIADPSNKFENVAVGVNGAVDLIVKGTTILNSLNPQSNSSSTLSLDHNSLSSIQDLEETFSYFHLKGAGGERYMENLADFQQVLSIARNNPEAQYFIGGNAALMAEKFSSLLSANGKVLIGCPAGPILKSLFNPNILFTQSTEIKQDEYHIIMEFSKGERWNGNIAPIASRFIFSHDIANSKMSALEELLENLDKFNPDLLVLSGFHMVEATEESYWSVRLKEIANLLKFLSRNIPIHIELASMSNKAFVKALKTMILPLTDSIGLNEQELWILCQCGGGPHCKSDSPDGPPLVSESADIVTWILQNIADVPNSRLTRIHFHTLTYHISAIVTNSKWRNQISSVLAGTRIAANQACDDDAALNPEKFQLRFDKTVQLTALEDTKISIRSVIFDPASPVIAWRNDDVSLYLTPVLVCKKPIKTVGLGDAISATGLIYSNYV